RLDGRGDGRVLLPDGDVDADHLLVGADELLLVDDRVDAHRGLAGLTVADDQLALTAADRDHRVDGLDAGLHRLGHGLAVGDARGNDVDLAAFGGLDRALAVDRLAEGVDDAAEHPLAHRHAQELAGRADGVALLDLEVVTEDDGADDVLLEVHHLPGDDARALVAGVE